MPPLYHHSCYPTKDAQRNHFFIRKTVHGINCVCE
jgi:hypothetical protein